MSNINDVNNFSAYTMRSVLNITITQMIYRKAKEGNNVTDLSGLTCDVAGSEAVKERLGFEWDEELQGIILGAFYWVYVSEINKFDEKFSISNNIASNLRE